MGENSLPVTLVGSMCIHTCTYMRILSVQYMCIPAVLLSVAKLILTTVSMGQAGLMLYLVN